jgi:hypothetical protein
MNPVLPENQNAKILIGMAMLAMAALIYLSNDVTLPPHLDPKPHEAAGRMLAQQALAVRDGGPVTVITRDTTTFKNPAADIQLASVLKTLRRARVSVAAIHRLQVDPLRPVEVPPGDFFELIRKNPPGSVIVSLMGPPLLTEAQRAALGKIRPSIVAFCSGSLPDQVNLRLLFAQGLLKAAVVSRATPLPSAVNLHSQREWFDRSFVAVTATNLEALATRAAKSP